MVGRNDILDAKFFLVGSFFIFFLFMLIVAFYSSSLTGFTLHDLEISNPVAGHLFRGFVQYDLPQTISTSAVVRVELGGSSRELPLSSVITRPSLLGQPIRVIDYPILEVSAIYYPNIKESSEFSTHLQSSELAQKESTTEKGSIITSPLDQVAAEKLKEGRSNSESSTGFSKGKGFSASGDSLGSGSAGKFGFIFSIIGRVISDVEENAKWKRVNLDLDNPGVIPAEFGAGLAIAYVSHEGTPVSSDLVEVSYDLDESAFLITTDYSIESSVYKPSVQGPVSLDLSRFGFQVPNTENLPIKITVLEDSRIISEAYESYEVDTSPENSTAPQIGASLSPPSANSTCERSCTEFSSCSLPTVSIGLNGTVSGSPSSMQSTRTRTCFCIDGSLEPVVETQTCSVLSFSEGLKSFLPLETGSGSSISFESSEFTLVQRISSKGGLSPSNSPSSSTPSRGSNSNGAGARGTQSVADWTRTITQTSRDIAVAGALKSDLEENSRVQISYGGEKHSVGIRAIDVDSSGKRYIDVEVASEPQYGRLYQNQQEPFDLNSDGFFDVGVTFTGYSNDQATIVIEPIKGDGPLQLSPGEKGIQVNSKEFKSPVAYVILKDQFPPRLNIILVQSELQLPSYCSNLMQDFDEEGVDCGPSCRTCYEDHPFYARIASIALVFLLGLTCLFVFKRRLISYG